MERRRFLAMTVGALVGAPGAPGAFLRPGAALAVPMVPPHRLSLANPHTGEHFSGPYRDSNGPIASAMAELSHFLRDFHSGQTIAFDVKAIDFLVAVMSAVGASHATVLSAYRTRATNRMLARTTFGVADNSQHIYGRAIDIRLDTRLEEAMHAARAMKRGGVGWYPRSHFIHIDSGPVRNWTLDGGGFDHMLIRLEQLLARRGIPRHIIATRPHHPLSVKQRLALGRALARAEFIARRH